jgi:hypothetical protein
MRVSLAALLIPLIATAALARDTVPVATPTGTARSCIPLRSFRETRVRDDRTIDFMTGNDTAYRNVLPHGCPGLGAERRFAYETAISQLCSSDIITVLYQTGPARGASCGLGPFDPVTLAKRRR